MIASTIMYEGESSQLRRSKELGLSEGIGKLYNEAAIMEFVDTCSTPEWQNRVAQVGMLELKKHQISGSLELKGELTRWNKSKAGHSSNVQDVMDSGIWLGFGIGEWITDVKWVEALGNAGIPTQDILRVCDVKDELATEAINGALSRLRPHSDTIHDK
jgi:hypothetical protein